MIVGAGGGGVFEGEVLVEEAALWVRNWPTRCCCKDWTRWKGVIEGRWMCRIMEGGGIRRYVRVVVRCCG